MRLFPFSIVSGFLVLASPLLAGLATASQDATHLYLENDVLRIAVLRTTGSLDGIIHKQSGVNLQSNNVNNQQAIWFIGLGTKSISYSSNLGTKSFTGTVATSATGASLNLTWKGLTGAAALPNVTVKASISVRTDSQFSYWNIEVDGLGSNPVAIISYPYITGIGQLGQSGDDDVLLVPTFKGTLSHNPTANFTIPTGGAYPGYAQSMQMLSYFDKTSGFYFASDDTQGNKKGFFWQKTSSPAGDFNIQISNNLNGVPADTVTVPYNLIVGVTQGDWYASADLYRSWAVQQAWTQQSRTKKVPAWLHDMALSEFGCAHGCQATTGFDLGYTNYVQKLKQSSQFFNVSMGELWGWEKYGSGADGDYFPPQEGWIGFDAMVESLRPYKLKMEASALFLETGSDLYKSGTMNSSEMLDPQGTPWAISNSLVDDAAGDANVFMDFSTEPWRQYVVSEYQTLASHGADLLGVESSINYPPIDCFNPAHQHPPLAGGNWQPQAWIDISRRIASAVVAANPNAALDAEEPAEIYLPYYSLHQGTIDQVELANQEQVPLFQYVYHDSILFRDVFAGSTLDGSYFRLTLARDLTWGQMPDWPIPNNPGVDAQSFLQAAIAIRTTYGKKFLVDGIMQPAPQISVPTTLVSWNHTWAVNTPGSGQYSSIQESAWRATDGTVGIILTNIAPSSVTFSLPISYSRLELPPGAAYTVQSTGGSAAITLDANMVKDSAYSITLTSQQILLVTLTPKGPQAQISAGGVVMHASTSTTVSPGSLFDIYGTNLASNAVSAPQGSLVLPSLLGNVQVLVNGIPAPLLFAGPAQIVAQIPSSILTGPASVVVFRDGAASTAATIAVQPAAPTILTYGTNRAIVQNQDYSLNSSTNPAQTGSYATAYLIGSGPVAPAVVDGEAAASLSQETLNTTVSIGGTPAQVLFAGMAPGFVGLVQINFQVPKLAPGDYPLQVNIGTAQSNMASMTVGQ